MSPFESEFRKEIQKYRDSDGLITPIPHPGTSPNGSGNGLLYSSLYYLCLHYRKWLTVNDWYEYEAMLMDSMTYMGLLNRGPHHPDQEAMDDYTAVTAVCSILGLLHVSTAILEYGRNNKITGPHGINLKYVYNNVKPGTLYHPDGRTNWSAWLGRMPQLVAHFHFSARQKCPLRYRIAWALSIFAAAHAKEDNHDAWLFSWLLIQTRRSSRATLVSEWVSRRWQKVFDKKIGTMDNLLARVLSSNHPIKYAWPTNYTGNEKQANLAVSAR